MSNYTPDSPTARLFAALMVMTPETAVDRIATNRSCRFDAERIASEHEIIVAERLAAVTAERNRLREALEIIANANMAFPKMYGQLEGQNAYFKEIARDALTRTAHHD